MKDEIYCKKGKKLEECEMDILKSAVKKNENLHGQDIVNSPEIQDIIDILENFIKRKGLICYGGTAINNILPKKEQFYDKSFQLPDYDVFSMNALNDAKELANIYYHKGYETEAKSGVHHGTYKVYVNFIAIADITFLTKEIFLCLKKESIHIFGIQYAPANYLRMGMYLELSRPLGDISRWEKVLKRLTILNKTYPMNTKNCLYNLRNNKIKDKILSDKIYDVLLESFIELDCVFFGGFAISVYSEYMPKDLKKIISEKIPDFYVLTTNLNDVVEKTKIRLEENKIKNIEIIKHPSVGEIISQHYQIKINGTSVALLFTPLECYNYNEIEKDGNKIKIATIDTMMTYYLCFLYIDRKYFLNSSDKIVCMSSFLFGVQVENRLKQKGVLKRFIFSCIGKPHTKEEIQKIKMEKYNELKNKKDTKEYEEWFLNYRPFEEKNKKKFTRKRKYPMNKKKWLINYLSRRRK
uniref:Poly(A) polymerase catalytic subunit domain-containing protein n=1 Tax=viral metagenome TaxID=1070528 RepID=A0A6C0H7M3_9ZZZZ